MFDYSAARGIPQGFPLSLGQLEQAPEFGGEVPGVASLEARQPALLGWVFGRETLGDLREA